MATSGTTFDIGQTISPNRPLGLWRLMSGFRLSYLFAVISLSISALAKTSTFLLLRYFIDNVLAQHKPVGNMVLVALGFIGLALFEGGFAFTAGRLAAFTAENIVRRLRNYVYDHIQRLSFAYHSKAKTGELIQRATSDVDAINRIELVNELGPGEHFQPVLVLPLPPQPILHRLYSGCQGSAWSDVNKPMQMVLLHRRLYLVQECGITLEGIHKPEPSPGLVHRAIGLLDIEPENRTLFAQAEGKLGFTPSPLLQVVGGFCNMHLRGAIDHGGP